MIQEIQLDTKKVGEIQGQFYIPDYQRGYRWEKEEVIRLLDDVYSNGTQSYCLQPVVIRRLSEQDIIEKKLESGEWFEIVDGQQRLTTIYLIYWYMFKISGGFLCQKPRFTLFYETRKDSGTFLKNIDTERKEENIDYWFICNAYETIQNWFDNCGDSRTAMINIYKYFAENVKVIWYEVDSSEDAIALFTRLNIGKIPLTSAELVKALFLSQGNSKKLSIEKQGEIALQWDNIEKELHDDSLWYFLSNLMKAKYQTRINLVLDLMAKKPIDKRDPYFTFFYFDSLRSSQSLDGVWQQIQQTFLTLKDWYEDHEYYHKIGYLIASESSDLQGLFELSQSKTKTDFKQALNEKIRQSIECNDNYAELSYEKRNDYIKISRLLLLFNVESVRQNGERTEWFPFDKFKYSDTQRNNWSLEHIHAQNSEGLRTEEVWRQWIELHIPSVKAVADQSGLIEEMERLLAKPKIEGKDFDEVQRNVFRCLSAQGSTEYLHSIANLALLNTRTNAVLNNSTFDVKRNEIIEMDKNGQYIPFCTKMVFLKYYSPSDNNQIHFWGPADRVAYIQRINLVLKDYLGENLIETGEV